MSLHDDEKFSGGSLDESYTLNSDAIQTSDILTSRQPPVADQSQKTSTNLQAGDVLLERFTIVRFIARGGMGEVFEAEDGLRKTRVAIKTLLPKFAADPNMEEQLRVEITNATRVAHRNVCRVYEVFRDNTRSLLFISMELLQGELLSEYLKRKAPLPQSEIVDLSRQMAEGLNAAHDVGIVHQDFKPGNVILVTEKGRVRALITDFGLALNLEADGRERGMAGGNLACMAPEQAFGHTNLSPAVDIYALGVVVYQLATKRLPIDGNASELLERKKTEDPVPPKHYRHDLSREWNRAILRCLERHPENRFGSTLELIRVLDGTARRRRRLAYGAIVAAIVIAIAAGSSGFIARRWMAIHRTPTVAVLGVNNVTGDEALDWLGTELSEGLTANLSKTKGLHSVPVDEVVLTRGEFPQAALSPEREDLSDVRRALGADYLIVGSYGLSADHRKLVLMLKVQNPQGEFISEIQQQGNENDYRRLISNTAAQIRHAIGAQALPEVEADEIANVYPENSDARRLYFESLSRLRALDAVSALDLGTRAEKEENSNPAIHALLAEAYSQLKNMPNARAQAQRAFDLAGADDVPSDYKMGLQARLAELSNNWSRAIQTWSSLYELSREKLDYGLLLANAQVMGNRPSNALATLQQLSKEPKPIGDDPRIPLAAAQAYSSIGKYQEEIEAAKTALRAAQNRGWKLMQARADLELCWAQQRIGRPEAQRACDDARSAFALFNDSINSDVALNNLANWLVQFNRYQEAKEAYERVVTTMSSAEDPRDAAGAHLNEAKVLLLMGQPQDLSEAQMHVHRSLELSMRIGDAYDEGRARLILANIKSHDSLSAAKDEVREALRVSESAGDLDNEGYAWSNLSQYQQLDGDLGAALESASKSLEIRRQLGVPSSIAATLTIIGDIEQARGSLDAARRSYQEALSQRTELEIVPRAEIEISLAQVDFNSGNLDLAAKEASTADAVLRTVPNSNDDQATALVLLARIALRQKGSAPALAILDQASELKSTDDDVKTYWLIANGEVFASEHEWQKARQQFEAARHNADASHNAYASLDARILADKTALSLKDSSAKGDLLKAQREARSKQFFSLAASATPSPITLGRS